MNFKTNTYYKCYYDNDDSTVYDILYISKKYVYGIASKRENNILVKKNKATWGVINIWQDFITRYNIKTEEISKEDLFLELL